MSVFTPATAALLAATIASTALSLDAQPPASTRVIITNNDVSSNTPNDAAIFKLSGSSLISVPLLRSKGRGVPVQFFAINEQAIATVGGNVCTFVTDPGTSDIVAFNTTNFAAPVKIGVFVDPTGSGNYAGISLATRGTILIAGYTATNNIGVWTINSDCSLTPSSLASQTPTSGVIDGLGISPDQKTLVVTYGTASGGVESFAISGTTLTSSGLYDTTGTTAAVDFSPDGKFVFIGDYNSLNTQIELFPVNSDSTLGPREFYTFSAGGKDSSDIWMSPDGTVLYVSNNDSNQITTLGFHESEPPNRRLAFRCITPVLNNPAGGTIVHTGGLATANTTGKGGYLYVAEVGNPSAVGLLQIPPNGCPVEVSGSPFINPTSGFPATLSAYPPRPF